MEIEHFLRFMGIYGFLLLTGFGIYVSWVPVFLRKVWLLPLLLPGLGLAQLSIISMYLVYFSIPIAITLPISLGMTGILLAIGAFLKKKQRQINQDVLTLPCHSVSPLKTHLKTVFKHSLTRWAMLGILLILLVFPVMKGGILTTPFRGGIDQIGYAQAGQYLYQGGTLKDTEQKTKALLHDPDLNHAPQAIGSVLDANVLINYTFFILAHRWGFPAVIAVLAQCVHLDHVYRIAFPILIFSYLLSVAFSFILLHRTLHLPTGLSLLGSLGVGFNVNLLNILYEGHYAEVFVLPYCLLIIILALEVRFLFRQNAEKNFQFHEYRSFFFLISFLVAAIIPAYSWGLLVAILVLFTTFLLDILLTRRWYNHLFLFFTGSLGVGFLMVLPYSIMWFQDIFGNINKLGVAGGPQPHWATLPDILGLLDIYNPSILPHRDGLTEALLLLITLLMLGGVFYLVHKQDKPIDKTFWLAPFLLVVAAYLKAVYIEHTHSYQYMKMYTMLLPFVFSIVFYWAFQSFLREGKALQGFKYVCVLLVLLNGIAYVQLFKTQGGMVTRDMYRLYHANLQETLKKSVIYTNVGGGIAVVALVPLLPFNWLNNPDIKAQSWVDYRQKPVFYLFNRHDFIHPEDLTQRFGAHIFYQNKTYLLYNVDKPLESLCKTLPCPQLQHDYEALLK